MNHIFKKIFPALVRGIDELELNPVTLVFKGKNKSLEADFIDYYANEKRLQIRAAMVIGIALYALFGFLDALLLDELKSTFWFIRFGVVVPFSIACLSLTFTILYRKWNQQIILMSNLVGGIGIIWMVVIANPAVAQSYYAGLILVFIYVYTFSGLRFIWAAITCWGIVMLFEVVTIPFSSIPPTILINNNFFLVTSNVLSMFAAYFIEYSFRRNYYLAKLLDAEKQKVEMAKSHLEHQVQKRILQLSEANRELSNELDEKEKLFTRQKELQEQLVQSQKMEAIGQLAGGVAHDFNNLLTVINGYSDKLLEEIDKDDIAFGPLTEIHEAGKRAGSLTRQLLAYSRKQIMMPVVINLNELLQKLNTLLTRLIGENIKLVYTFDPRIHQIKADPGQLEQVIINLLINARDAMPRGGEIRMETKTGIFQMDDADPHQDSPPNSAVILTISDTGIGIEEDVIDHIFDPFYTTKGKEQGTGLGLSTVYGIVKQSDASIQVYSKIGQGTTFTLTFKAIEPEHIPVKAGSSEHQDLHGFETILTIEDEKAVRLYLVDVLERYGYKVLAASDGKEAIALFEKHADEIDLLITDMIMPGPSGKQVVAEILKIKPELKYVYITGYTDDIVGRHGILDKQINILQKPFARNDLLKTVRSILHPQSGKIAGGG